MKPISGKRLCKLVEEHGWQFQRIRGSHHIDARLGDPVIVTIPVHGNRDLKIGTLRRILKDSGIPESEL